MSDEPRYGERAPEGWTWTPPGDEASAPTTDTAAGKPATAEPAVSFAPADPNKPTSDAPKLKFGVSPGSFADRIFTWGLLIFGAISVMSNISTYLNLTPTLNALIEQLKTLNLTADLGEFTDFGLANTMGFVIMFTEATVLGLTWWWSLTRLRQGKRAFWVPLVGAATSSFLTALLLLITLFSDPAVFSPVLDTVSTAVSTGTIT